MCCVREVSARTNDILEEEEKRTIMLMGKLETTQREESFLRECLVLQSVLEGFLRKHDLTTLGESGDMTNHVNDRSSALVAASQWISFALGLAVVQAHPHAKSPMDNLIVDVGQLFGCTWMIEQLGGPFHVKKAFLDGNAPLYGISDLLESDAETTHR